MISGNLATMDTTNRQRTKIQKNKREKIDGEIDLNDGFMLLYLIVNLIWHDLKFNIKLE